MSKRLRRGRLPDPARGCRKRDRCHTRASPSPLRQSLADRTSVEHPCPTTPPFLPRTCPCTPSSPRSRPASSSAAPGDPVRVPVRIRRPPPSAGAPDRADWLRATSPTASPPAGPDGAALRGESAANVAIVTSYNDMLSAHAAVRALPPQLKTKARSGRRRRAGRGRRARHVRRHHAGPCRHGTSAVQPRHRRHVRRRSRSRTTCSTRALMLGVCDKIVPGLLIGALAFGHLPTVFVPAGPMPSGLPNAEKSHSPRSARRGQGRPRGVAGGRGRAYHSPGTCTFYGTANSNQWSSRRWACTCRARASSTPAARCARR